MSSLRRGSLLLFALSSCTSDPGADTDAEAATSDPSSAVTVDSPSQTSTSPSATTGAASDGPDATLPPATGSTAPAASSSSTAPTTSVTGASPPPNGEGGAGAPSSPPALGSAGSSADGGSAGVDGTGGAAAGSGGTPSLGGAGTGGAPDAGTVVGGAGGGGGSPNEAPYNPCPPGGEPCRIVPFGDSITDGYNVPGGYRMELFHLALEAGHSIEFAGSGANGPQMVDGVPFPQDHEGHSGYTIDDAPQAGRSGISPLIDTVLGFEPDIILLKIGTNDLDQDVDVGDAPNRLGNLLDDIFAKDDHVLVVVAQIIPSRDAGLNAVVATYNAALAPVVAERADAGQHVLLADMESAFLADSNYQTTLLADGLHPNETGYALLGQTWYGVIGELFR